MEQEYIDLSIVAEALELNKATLLSAIDKGELTAIKGVWRGYRTTAEWVAQWIASKTINLPTESEH